MSSSQLVEVFEPFTFRDGVRYAWVTYRIGDGDRRAMWVREHRTPSQMRDTAAWYRAKAEETTNTHDRPFYLRSAETHERLADEAEAAK